MKSIPKKIPYKEWLKIFTKVPRICVDLVVQGKDGVILTKRNIYPYKGYWHIPGAGILYGEKIEDTIKRIAKDELNIKVKFIKILGIIEFKVIKNYGHPLTIECLSKPISEKIPKTNSEGEEIKYFKIAPQKTIREQKDFLIKYGYLKKDKKD